MRAVPNSDISSNDGYQAALAMTDWRGLYGLWSLHILRVLGSDLGPVAAQVGEPVQ